MTFNDMLQATYDDLGYTSSPSTAQVTRIKRWINEGYRHVMAIPGMEQLRDGQFDINTVTGQGVYALPMAVNVVYDVTQVTNAVRLRMITKDAFRTIDPGLQNSSSFSDAWIPWGYGVVQRHPASTGLWAVSSAAGDTTQTFAINGVRANGDIAAPVTASSALTGTTRVQIGTLTDYVQITQLDMSAAAVGVVTVYDAAVSGNVILRLQPGQTSAQYQQVRLWPTPASDNVAYTFDVQFVLSDLVNSNDIPLLPTDFHDVPSLYARMREYTRVGDEMRLRVSQAEWKQRTDFLKFTVTIPKDYQPVASNQAAGYGWNNLGPNFPATVIW